MSCRALRGESLPRLPLWVPNSMVLQPRSALVGLRQTHLLQQCFADELQSAMPVDTSKAEMMRWTPEHLTCSSQAMVENTHPPSCYGLLSLTEEARLRPLHNAGVCRPHSCGLHWRHSAP